ncbi:uncharacterized protein UTRI_01451 [Ustilago trichophora]|uniref:Uncharacterized protein n=1 Tax=Ustilago trichophora TaxID=86804 RepID=A0A5C3DWF0_9BASI|nr:uncharacterized protein UTRI_01451 [Ustilago trichophora]
MTRLLPCPRCKHSYLPSAFVGARGRPVKRCSTCRSAHKTAAQATQTPVGTPSVRSLSRRRSSSPPSASASPLSTRANRDPGGYASASSVAALEERFGRLEQRLDSQLGELLHTIQASQQAASPASPPPAPSPVPPSSLQTLLPPPPRPQAPPAVALALPSAGQPSGTTGELPPLSLSRCFAWVPQEVVALVERDQLKPEQLVKLRNPESRVSKEPPQATPVTIGDGGALTYTQESAETRVSTFVKAIPNIAALAHIWLVYIAIRVRHTGSLALNEALLAYLEHLLECDHLYQWQAVADYHLAVCRRRFGTGAVHEWSSYDQELSSQILYPRIKTGNFTNRGETSSSSRQPTSSSSRPQNRVTRAIAAAGSFDPCRRYNAGQPCPGCSRHHACLHCQHKHPLTQCPMLASKSATNPPLKKAT